MFAVNNHVYPTGRSLEAGEGVSQKLKLKTLGGGKGWKIQKMPISEVWIYPGTTQQLLDIINSVPLIFSPHSGVHLLCHILRVWLTFLAVLCETPSVAGSHLKAMGNKWKVKHMCLQKKKRGGGGGHCQREFNRKDPDNILDRV